jgi:hypothetical protein
MRAAGLDDAALAAVVAGAPRLVALDVADNPISDLRPLDAPSRRWRASTCRTPRVDGPGLAALVTARAESLIELRAAGLGAGPAGATALAAVALPAPDPPRPRRLGPRGRRRARGGRGVALAGAHEPRPRSQPDRRRWRPRARRGPRAGRAPRAHADRQPARRRWRARARRCVELERAGPPRAAPQPDPGGRGRGAAVAAGGRAVDRHPRSTDRADSRRRRGPAARPGQGRAVRHRAPPDRRRAPRRARRRAGRRYDPRPAHDGPHDRSGCGAGGLGASPRSRARGARPVGRSAR